MVLKEYMKQDFTVAFEFAKKRAIEYFLLVIVQSIYMMTGVILLFIGAILIGKIPVLTVLLTIFGTIIMCYSMWQLMLIQGALMYCVCANIKSKDKQYDIKTFLPIIKNRQGEYAIYLLFVSLVTLVPFSVLFLSAAFKSLSALFAIIGILGFIYLIPFFTYSFPAFILNTPGENVTNIYQKIYKTLDLNGVLLIIVVFTLTMFISLIAGILPFVNVILSPVVQIFTTLMVSYIFAKYYISRKIFF